MEPILSEPQTLLRDSAVRLARQLGGPRRARRLREEGAALDSDAWREAVRAGWLGIAVPQERGGLGMGGFEQCLVLEEAGRQLLALPLAEAGAAAWACAHSGEGTVRESALRGLLEEGRLFVPALPQEGWGSSAGAQSVAARPERAGAVLDGRVRFVPFAPCADAFLVSAGTGAGALLARVAKGAAGLSITTATHVDGSTGSDLEFTRVAVEPEGVLARGAEAERLCAAMGELLALGTAAQLLGLASAALDMTLEYIRLRQQFGKALGSFQALQHRAADCFVDIELNRSLVYRVFAAWDAGEAHAAMVSAAKARTSRAALEITRAALQLHGAIGYTDEHDIGLYYKRALALAALYGNDVNHTTRFSRLALALA